MTARIMFGLVTSLILIAAFPAWTEERCGMWSERGDQLDQPPRFRLLQNFPGFLDMQTCLVWSLDIDREKRSFDDAKGICGNAKGIFPRHPGGWQLPSAAELTSFHSGSNFRTELNEIVNGLKEVKAGEHIWTREPGITVYFDHRTNMPVLADIKLGEDKALAWCVYCCPANGIR